MAHLTLKFIACHVIGFFKVPPPPQKKKKKKIGLSSLFTFFSLLFLAEKVPGSGEFLEIADMSSQTLKYIPIPRYVQLVSIIFIIPF